MSARRCPAHDPPERRAPLSALGETRRAEHIRVDADAAGLEEHLSRDFADVRAFDLPLRDDARRIDRP